MRLDTLEDLPSARLSDPVGGGRASAGSLPLAQLDERYQTWGAGGGIDGSGAAGQVASWVDADTLTGIAQGAGGGLNADLVDGEHASAFARVEDTARLQGQLDQVELELEAELRGKAPIAHRHTVADVNGLRSELDARVLVGTEAPAWAGALAGLWWY